MGPSSADAPAVPDLSSLLYRLKRQPQLRPSQLVACTSYLLLLASAAKQAEQSSILQLDVNLQYGSMAVIQDRKASLDYPRARA